MLLFASVDDLNDENIQSYLIVDQVDQVVSERHQMVRHEESDGLQADETKVRCENTVQGVELLTDSIGKWSILWGALR